MNVSFTFVATRLGRADSTTVSFSNSTAPSPRTHGSSQGPFVNTALGTQTHANARAKSDASHCAERRALSAIRSQRRRDQCFYNGNRSARRGDISVKQFASVNADHYVVSARLHFSHCVQCREPRRHLARVCTDITSRKSSVLVACYTFNTREAPVSSLLCRFLQQWQGWSLDQPGALWV